MDKQWYKLKMDVARKVGYYADLYNKRGWVVRYLDRWYFECAWEYRDKQKATVRHAEELFRNWM